MNPLFKAPPPLLHPGGVGHVAPSSPNLRGRDDSVVELSSCEVVKLWSREGCEVVKVVAIPSVAVAL